MTIHDVDIDPLAGGPAPVDRHRGQVVPVVTVPSRRGFTPRYAGPVAPGGTVAARFEPRTGPRDERLVAAVENPLPR